MQDKLQSFQLTTTGDKAINQDCIASQVLDNYGLFVVADGLGGHHAGEKASQFFCQGLFRQSAYFQKQIKRSKKIIHQVFTDWFDATIDDMATLFAGDEEAKNAYTTCAVLYLDPFMSVTAHCGDTRIYRMNAEKIIWRTQDHSRVQQQFNQGDLSEREMGIHPEQNQLIRSINITKSYPPDINVYSPIKSGETFLVCTDGFWEYSKEKDLLQLAQPDTDKETLKKMTKMMHLRAHGKSDNITVQWIRGL